ncbi:uncharacterized protein LOC103511656 [Diaphorina citri]|uniref:Uncharacterized protein LOC103511656 n=1 Tax=Diaphorina citri TaxID=121845 RepID=A0A1S3D541_DIACI|nr:uncharacterized protein LOC103511656 [Diaphorina citri]
MYHNHVWGALHFAPNYTRSVVERINHGQHTKSATLDFGSLNFWIDRSDKYISTLVQRDVVISLMETKELFFLIIIGNDLFIISFSSGGLFGPGRTSHMEVVVQWSGPSSFTV